MLKNLTCFLIILLLLQLACQPERVEESFIIQPKFLTTEQPLIYPTEAFNQGIEGKTVVQLLVSIEGKVSETKILRSSGSLDLDEAALRMVKSSAYEPGSIDGVPSEFWLHLPVLFRLNDKDKFIKDIEGWTQLAISYQNEIKTRTIENKSDLYKKLFYHYQKLAREIGNTRSLTANLTILSIVEKSIGKPWQEYHKKWPLGFLLFEDYLKKYPNCEYASNSREDLIRYLRREIEILEQRSLSRKSYGSIYSLLSAQLKKLYDQDLQ
jgi:TonB family protein